MNLQFESLDELKAFIGFLGDVRRASGESAPIYVGESTNFVSHDDLGKPLAQVATERHALPTEGESTNMPASATSTRKPRAKKGETTAPATESASAGEAVSDSAQSATAETQAAATPNANAGDIKAAIAQRAAELGEVDPVKHLNDSRAFIAAHTLPNFFRTQQVAGVGDNSINYTAHERAMHTAAMEAFVHYGAAFPTE